MWGDRKEKEKVCKSNMTFLVPDALISKAKPGKPWLCFLSYILKEFLKPCNKFPALFSEFLFPTRK